jgi:glutathione peroxidase-family protein
VDPQHHQQPGHQGVAKPQVETAREWGLKTEPWLFLIDKEGKIANRFEGGLTIDEVEPELLKLLD